MTVRIAVVGVGLVGSEFLSQLFALDEDETPFKVVYVSNSKGSIFNDTDGFTKSEIEAQTSSFSFSSTNPTPDKLHTVLSSGSPVIVIDNTSSDQIAALYPTWILQGYSIVTPNKKAFSGTIELYARIENALKAKSTTRGVGVWKEATVGAGLPIIGTLKTLVETGDEIVKIEGVFSGTLSYIFNEFSPVNASGSLPSFSSVVAIAKEKGYTEPHPADDLNGADVARKLTILSRHIPSLLGNLRQGYLSVSTYSLIPDELSQENLPKTGEEFVEKLKAFDDKYDQLRQEAEKKGSVLRYVGVINVANGQIEARLDSYPKTHPFATSLQGSDNIIAFHTKRYGARPLIVQGAGAGAAVTAMGVLGDVLQAFKQV